MDVCVGALLGPYEIVAPLGAGSMGEVWRARDTRLDRSVAIKVLPSGFASDEQRRARFVGEARAISKLSHPRICTLYDVGNVNGCEYLVMEYLEGDTLAKRIRASPMPLEQVIRYGAEICEALHHAHSAGIVHRDLKPANVMLTRSGVKLLDFGLAKQFASPVDSDAPTAAATTEGAILGTLVYMAPEQLRGEPLDARADIFALGTVLFEMASGRRPFQGTNNATAVAAILYDDPPPLETLVPEVPPALAHIVRRCLAKDRDQRWNCAHDLGYELAHTFRKPMQDARVQTGGIPALFDTSSTTGESAKSSNAVAEGIEPHAVPTTHQGKAYRTDQQLLASGTMQRGEFFPDIFDSTSYISRTARSPEDLIYEEIRGGAMISCQFAYSADQGSLHWLALCDDPLYAVFRESIEVLSANARNIFAALGDEFLASSPDFISLGPGNGQKDRILLKALLEYFDTHQIRSDLFYYPVDVSERLIGTAIRTIANDRAIALRIKMKAIHADFSKLALFRPVFDFRAAPNLFVFLGNTLGNVQNEISFLQKVKAAMRVGDALIIEVRLNTGELKLGGHIDDQRGLSFAPLAQLGVPFDPAQIEYHKEESVSQIPGTVTMAGHYRKAVIRGTSHDDVFLSCVNYYDPDSFANALAGSALGFDVSAVFKERGLGIFVARRR
jgi:serine/threonine protein kinase